VDIRYDTNNAVKTYERRKRLMAQYALALMDGDRESVQRDREKSIAETDKEDVTREEQLLNEAHKRFEWLMNPSGSKYAAWATSAGFVWYLGLTPAAGVVNLSQTAIVSFPELAATYGAAKSLKALNRSMLEVLAARRLMGECCRSLYPARFSQNYPRCLYRAISLLPDYAGRSKNPCGSSLSG